MSINPNDEHEQSVPSYAPPAPYQAPQGGYPEAPQPYQQPQYAPAPPPYGQVPQNVYPPAGYPYAPQGLLVDPRQIEGEKHARRSLIFGILSLFIFGIIFGILALRQARKAEALGVSATAGKTLGIIGLAFYAVSNILFFYLRSHGGY